MTTIHARTSKTTTLFSMTILETLNLNMTRNTETAPGHDENTISPTSSTNEGEVTDVPLNQDIRDNIPTDPESEASPINRVVPASKGSPYISAACWISARQSLERIGSPSQGLCSTCIEMRTFLSSVNTPGAVSLCRLSVTCEVERHARAH